MTVDAFAVDAGHVSRYSFEVSAASRDVEWDDFLRCMPGGSHRQSCPWARAKTMQGWEARRVLVRRQGRLVGGAQLLMKPLPVLPFLGKIAYCAKGPVVREDEPELADRLVELLHRLCRRERVQAFIMQPADQGPSIERLLRNVGCVESPIPIAPEATALVDLTPDLETIQRRLGKNLRKQLHRSERRGVQVRRGGAADLETFYRLLSVASERLDYGIFPANYYRRLWDGFSETGQAQLFIAEYEGRAISAALCLVSGTRIVSTAVGWSGEHPELNPNDLLDWYTIRWAKLQGLREFELENLSYELARRITEGADPADLEPKGSDRYKLKWATDVVLSPRPYLYVPHPAVRALLRRVPERTLKSSLPTLATRFRPTAGD